MKRLLVSATQMRDEGDMTEMARGIFDGLELSEEERDTKSAIDRRFFGKLG
jgi:hypothetical protein